MPPVLQAYYSDEVTDATGQVVAGASVALYPVSLFAPGVLPTDAPAAAPLATATTDAGGRVAIKGLPPGDYHILVQYTPPGGTPQALWRYGVPVGPYEATRRLAGHALGSAIPRTLARLLGGLPVTVLCLGDGVTVGYQATGTVSGGWVARLAAALAAAYPAAQVVRYDPAAYATTLDAPIPSWTAAPVQGGTWAGMTPPPQIAVINAGVSADTTLRALRRLSNVTAASWSPPPDLYIVALGLEEMSADPTRAAAPGDFAAHLAALVDVLRAGGSEALLCTPHVGLPGAAVDDYAAAVRGVAAATGCGLVDLRQLWQDHYDPAAPNDGYGDWLDTTAGDTISPTDAGHAAIGDEVARAFDPPGALPLGAALVPAVECESVRLLNTSPLLAFAGAWTAQSGFALAALLASPREMQAATPGATLTFSARCGELYMLCRRWHDGGQVTVTVDGALLGTVDLYRAAPASTADLADANGAIAPRDRVPLALGLADTVHTVTLQLAATANPAAQGTVWRFDALDLVRLRRGGLAVEGVAPLQRVQAGQAAIALAGAPTGTAAITFPEPYTGALPTVVTQSPHPSYYTAVSGVTLTGATLTLVQYAHAAVTDMQIVAWLAFG